MGIHYLAKQAPACEARYLWAPRFICMMLLYAYNVIPINILDLQGGPSGSTHLASPGRSETPPNRSAATLKRGGGRTTYFGSTPSF